jgi:hypothetical protein
VGETHVAIRPPTGGAAAIRAGPRRAGTRRRKPLLVVALAVDAQVLEPLAHPRGVPAVAVAADEELVPLAAARVALHFRAHRLGGLAHRLAVGSDVVA